MKSSWFRLVIAFACTCLHTPYGRAGVIALQDVLDSYAFSNGSILPGSQSFNIWNDSTGDKLVSDNGDAADLTIIYSNSAGPLGSASLEYVASSDAFRLSHGFGGSVSSNNPGSRVIQTVDILFSSHVTITDLVVDFTSLNSAGTSWETSKLGYLDASGNPFSPEPAIANYSAHSSIDGSPSTGWFLTDATETVANVGSNETTSGSSNGDNDNLTQADNTVPNALDFSDVDLAVGTQVGGFRWITILEDTRGISNSDTNLTATLTSLQPSGTISSPATVPEPSTLASLAFLSVGALGFHRKRRRMNQSAA